MSHRDDFVVIDVERLTTEDLIRLLRLVVSEFEARWEQASRELDEERNVND